MFETIVSSVLNQVLGSYVDNLDGSQLKLGIFSGKGGLIVLLLINALFLNRKCRVKEFEIKKGSY